MPVTKPEPYTAVSKSGWGDAVTDEVNASATHRVTDTGAHPASAITHLPNAVVAATTVQGALEELAAEKAPLASPTFTGTVTVPSPGTVNSAAPKTYVDNLLSQHLSGGGGYHYAALIGFTPAGTLSATNVQDAILEVAAEAGGGAGGGSVFTVNGDPGPNVQLVAQEIPMSPLPYIPADNVQLAFQYCDFRFQNPAMTGLQSLVVTSDWTRSDSYIERIGHTVNMYLSVGADAPVPADVAVLTLPQGFRPARGGVNGQWVLDGTDVRTAVEVTDLNVFASWATSEPWPPDFPPTNSSPTFD